MPSFRYGDYFYFYDFYDKTKRHHKILIPEKCLMLL